MLLGGGVGGEGKERGKDAPEIKLQHLIDAFFVFVLFQNEKEQ